MYKFMWQISTLDYNLLPFDTYANLIIYFEFSTLFNPRDLGIGSDSKVSVNAGLERLKVICFWKDGPVREFRSLEVIQINESANSFVRLVSNLVGVLNRRKGDDIVS